MFQGSSKNRWISHMNITNKRDDETITNDGYVLLIKGVMFQTPLKKGI